jgi:hypothetical protein
MRSVPFVGAVKEIKVYTKKKIKQIKGYKCSCGTFTHGFWTLLPSWHEPDCVINKKGKKK